MKLMDGPSIFGFFRNGVLLRRFVIGRTPFPLGSKRTLL